MQEEKKFGIMLSMGISKIYIIGQFILELVIISVLAFMISYFVANYSAKNMANNILTNVTKEITTKGEKEAKSSNISGGAELDRGRRYDICYNTWKCSYTYSTFCRII